MTAALSCLVACGQLGCRGDAPRPLVPPTGADALAVRAAELPKLDAAAVKAWALEQKAPVLLSLWAQWCAPCLAEMPFLDEAAMKHAVQVRIVAVNVDDTDAHTAKLVDDALATLRPRLPLAAAAGGAAELARGFGDTWPGVLPYHILIGADGKLVTTYAGPLDAVTDAGRTQFEVRVLSRLTATEEPQ